MKASLDKALAAAAKPQVIAASAAPTAMSEEHIKELEHRCNELNDRNNQFMAKRGQYEETIKGLRKELRELTEAANDDAMSLTQRTKLNYPGPNPDPT